MPLRRTKVGSRPAYQYGSKGTKYTYIKGDTNSENAARQSALMQGRAIERAKMEGTK